MTSNWTDQVIEEFGNRIGIPQLHLGDQNALRLDIMEGSSIGIIRISNDSNIEIVVYRSISAKYLGPLQHRTALKEANFRKPHSWPLQAACNQEELIVAVRIPERAFMVSSLEKALDELGKVLEKLN
jgi:hypothetical protein